MKPSHLSLEALGDILPYQKAHREQRKAPPLQKKGKKKPISKKVENRSLEALKELLAKQKRMLDAEQNLSAAPFSERPNSAAILGAASLKIDKLDPSAQVHQLFAKLVDSLTHLDQNGIKATTLVLGSDAFGSSIFSGSEITITEYSTAPKMFNIQLCGNPSALAFFQDHAASLASAFESGKFSFGVHRIDTELLAKDKQPLIEKVESDQEKEEAQK